VAEELNDLPESVKDDKLTINRAAGLFIGSFEHSQGSGKLQSYIFEFIHALQPNWKVAEDFKEQLRFVVTNPIRHIVLPNRIQRHVPVTDDDIEEMISIELQEMQRTFNQKLRSDPKYLADKMGIEMLKQENRFLHQKWGRIRPEAGNTRYSPSRDPHFSYICHYALEGNTTGSAVFDKLYEQIGEYLQSLASNAESQEQPHFKDLLQVVSRFNETHPGKDIAFPLKDG
jgi:hypothetical protein